MGDVRAVPLTGQDDTPRAGDGPLGGGGALSAVLQGGAVLPLGRAEVGGRHSPSPLAKASVQQHGRQGEALRHCGAGSIEAVEGHVLPPDGEAGTNALVQKVPSEEVIQGGGGLLGLVQRGGQGQLLHGGFGFFPGGFAKSVVLLNEVKGVG